MAIQASLGRLAKIVSSAVQNCATAEGLNRDEYKMIATFDPDHDRVYLVVGSTRSVDRPRWNLAITNNLAQEFGSRQSANYHVNTVVRHFDHLDQIDRHLVLVDNNIDMTDML